ncbi:hypothetical protein KUH140013_p0041 (plasmid) [Staphylococcus aureus]|nr:hypothetical protein KUH140013_p0041 [Staphylococcus aureus]
MIELIVNVLMNTHTYTLKIVLPKCCPFKS